ncbi:MAG: RNA-directed DNA polymerase [Bdellovibrionales bacterium]|nr:RNA-directed DNA polymerase [Bdellovibrionales bacterium]
MSFRFRRQKGYFLSQLSDPETYVKEIVRAYEREIQKGNRSLRKREELPLSAIYLKRRSLSRALAKSVPRGEYRFRPFFRTHIRTATKWRVVHQTVKVDHIVCGVVARLLGEAIEPLLSDSLYSYRTGKDWWKAISHFTTYIREHRSTFTNVRDRGLYVIRDDVREYTDSIPVGTAAPLWKMLSQTLESFATSPPDLDAITELLRATLRPVVTEDRHFPYCHTFGISTGTQVSNVVANFYLVELDSKLGQLEGAFYARYGDDLLFASPSIAVAQEARRQIDQTVAKLKLTMNAAKRDFLFFNGAGRESESVPKVKGCSQITFLGCSVRFDGTVSLKRSEARRFLRSIRYRVRNSNRVLHNLRVEQRATEICHMLGRVFNPMDVIADPSAGMLRRCVTDRLQLKAFDRDIALEVASALSGRSGQSAFRVFPYRMLRREFKLPSLVVLRNQWRS